MWQTVIWSNIVYLQIVMEGVRGASYDGDIAIDDVKLAEGPECAVSLNITPGKLND